MANHPLNLALRFALELWLLYALGAWGWARRPGLVGALLGAALALGAAALWGTFRVPNDGGAPRIRVSGPMRLALEGALFTAAVWALADAGHQRAAATLAAFLLLHYGLGYDRTWALLRNVPLAPSDRAG